MRPEELHGSYTPIVEQHRERRIGLASPWTESNFAAYIQMIVEEINEKTDYDLRIQPWHEYSQVKHRIRIARKRTDMHDVLRRLQWMALGNGVSLDVVKVGKALEEFIAGR